MRLECEIGSGLMECFLSFFGSGDVFRLMVGVRPGNDFDTSESLERIGCAVEVRCASVEFFRFFGREDDLDDLEIATLAFDGLWLIVACDHGVVLILFGGEGDCDVEDARLVCKIASEGGSSVGMISHLFVQGRGK